MFTLGNHLEALSAAERQRLEAWLDKFERSWDEQRLTAAVRKLPAAGPFRGAALVEMAKIDLEHRWQRGHRVGASYYLEAVPELGPADVVPPDLLLAEYEVRRQFGDAAGAAALAGRVPSLVDGLRPALTRTEAAHPFPALATGPSAETVDHVSGPCTASEGRGDESASLPEQFGRYCILRRLGRGGMGTVYLAHDTQLDRRVALKVPHLRPGRDQDLLQRFYREARAASTLDHPNLCRVYDAGAIDGTPYLSMAYIEGRPLADEVRARGSFPQRAAAALVRKLALALEAAHRAGVVHRDLKPSNVMLTQRGEPVVTDFGLARRDHPDDRRLTASGQLLGTPAYMAPEQVRGDTAAAGPACDVYALGVILYELLTGRPPFRGSPQAVFARILAEEPERPSAARPDLDPALEAACLKAMAKRPEDRFGSMQEFAAVLTHFLKGTKMAADTDDNKRRPRRRAGWLWTAGAAVGVMAITLALLARFRGDVPGPAPTTDGARAAAVATSSPTGEPPRTGAGLQAEEPVRTVTVKLTVGAGGDLHERVALDLGLGFPLWLWPVGGRPGEPAPFGAVPQQSSAAPVVRAGTDATFTFAAAGAPGQDGLQTTPQFLAGVHVGDIRRVGFAGPAAGDWELAGYEVQVNGRPVAAGQPRVRPRQVLEKDRAKLAEVGRTAAPLESERADLRDLARAKLATPDDARRLEEMEKQLSALAPEKAQLEARLQGRAPWFTAPTTDLPARADSPAVRSARVKILTRAHDGADTHNYVYFRAGAVKYLIGSPERPLTPAAGVQEFDLDLGAGPLTAADLRGWALGMLAAPQPQGDVPDRWHPRRLVVEIDGRVAYDSEPSDRDRRSLDAVRLIPPAQLDWDGTPRANTPDSREVFVWAAGTGAGLDDSNQPLPLPKPDELSAPKPEPVLAGAGADPQPPVVNTIINVNGGAPNFPGEGLPLDVAPADGPLGPTINITQNVIQLGIAPRPAGRPFQVANVRIVSDGVRVSDGYRVAWDLYGDESSVHHYEVDLVQLRPEDAPPNGARYALGASVPPGLRSWPPSPEPPAGLAASAYDAKLYLRPRVRAVPVDPATTSAHLAYGPARPIFPAVTVLPQTGPVPTFWRGGAADSPPDPLPPPPVPPHFRPVGPPAVGSPDSAVWPVGLLRYHGIVYDDAHPAQNILVRPADSPGEKVRLWLKYGMMPPHPAGKRRHLVAYAGFDGATAGTYKVTMTWAKTTAPFTGSETATVTAPNMVPLVSEILGGGSYGLVVRFDVESFSGDRAHPPALFGVRVVQEP